jgi:hypothetical protein
MEVVERLNAMAGAVTACRACGGRLPGAWGGKFVTPVLLARVDP